MQQKSRGIMFTHLRLHTTHSVLNSTLEVHKAVDRIAALGMSTAVITDDSNLCGAVQLAKACAKQNDKLKKAGSEQRIRPVYGITLWLWPAGLSRMTPEDPDGGWQVTLLAMDRDGYRGLCRLATAASRHMHYRPRVDLDLLREHGERLLCLTTDRLGPFGIKVATDDEAFAWGDRLAEIFKDRLYVSW
jgi:DNA polymerase-3 subunit alpha